MPYRFPQLISKYKTTGVAHVANCAIVVETVVIMVTCNGGVDNGIDD